LSHLDFEIRISSLCTLCLCTPEFILDVSSLASLSGAPLNQPAKRSTTVENSLQINPFYAKQSQCQVSQNQPKYFVINEIRRNGQLVIQTKQTQFKANKAKNKPNLTQNKPNSNPIQTQTKPIQSTIKIGHQY